jgi:DivIVA domain-containing protein
MALLLLVSIVMLVVVALAFGVFALLTGDDPGLAPADADHALPLPGSRPLAEQDVTALRFDSTIRGYRMDQVDRALRRTAYDIGYKDEMIAVLEAEVAALREGRTEDAELMRKAREGAVAPAGAHSADTDEVPDDLDAVEDEPEVLVIGVADDEVDAAVESEHAALAEAKRGDRPSAAGA